MAGAAIPWTGYLLGLLTSVFTRLSKPDIISMTIESGIQNTGIAIFMLKFTLGQPAADLTTGNTNFILNNSMLIYMLKMNNYSSDTSCRGINDPCSLTNGFCN